MKKYTLSRIFYILIITSHVYIVSCGYMPMSYYANKALGDKVYVQLQINLENTEESVRIKDAVNEAIISRFHSRVSNKDEADSILKVNIQNIQDSVIGTNAQGFATFYRVYVYIIFEFEYKGKRFSFSNPGYYDYAASLNNPITTYNNRSNAIIEAARQNLDKFISQIGYSVSF